MIDLNLLLQVAHQLFTVKVLREVELEFLGILSLASPSDEELLVILDEVAMSEQIRAYFIKQLPIDGLF